VNSLVKSENYIDKDSVGLSSEFYVMAKLISMGFQTSLTFGHTKTLDIHASKNLKTYSFQVKGAQHNKANSTVYSWRISKNKINKNTLYVFVNLNLKDENPKSDYYIIYGKDLEKLVKGKAPNEYIYSGTLFSYKDNWPK